MPTLNTYIGRHAYCPDTSKGLATVKFTTFFFCLSLSVSVIAKDVYSDR